MRGGQRNRRHIGELMSEGKEHIVDASKMVEQEAG